MILDQAIVRFGDSDEQTLQVIEAVQAAGVLFAGGAKWQGQWMMRLSVIGFSTSEADVSRSLASIIACWRDLRG